MSETQPHGEPTTTRRTVLLAGAGGVGLVALAACSTGESPGGAPHPKKNELVAKLTEVPVGGAIKVDLDGTPAIVARPNTQQVVCFSAICTHQGCTVEPVGDRLNCPCHQSQFNALTGQVLRGPASSPLPKIGVTVKNGEIVTT